LRHFQFAPNLELSSGSLDLLDEKAFLGKGGSIFGSKHFVCESFERIPRHRAVFFGAENEPHRRILAGERPVLPSVVQI
jgi:hypothetical protein